jgi:hypothetical protein
MEFGLGTVLRRRPMRRALFVLVFLALNAVGHAEDLYPPGRPARAAPPAREERAGRLAREAPPIPQSRLEGARRLENSRQEAAEAEPKPSPRTPSTRRR